MKQIIITFFSPNKKKQFSAVSELHILTNK